MRLLPARTFICALVVFRAILRVAPVDLVLARALGHVVGVYLSLLIVALLLFARVLGWLGHGSLLQMIET